MLTRRDFLAGSAATLAASALHAADAPARLTIGLELYSFRDAIAKQGLPAILAQAKAMGFDRVETGADFYGHTAADFRKLTDAAGLKVTSVHFTYDQLKKSVAPAQRDLETVGAHWAGVAWIPHTTFDSAGAQRAADDFNAWGKAFAATGHTFMYHVHGYEFGPAPQGGTNLDVLFQSTDPAQVKFQMDTFWIVVPGQDCVALLEKYPTRWRLMHIKDLRKGAPIGNPQGREGRADVHDSVPVGTGIIDWSKVLPLARKIGIADYFIEDESPDALTQVPQSLRYLNSRKW